MQNRWMQIIPSQGPTQKLIIYKFAGFQVKKDGTSHNCSEKVSNYCLKSQTENLRFLNDQKVWNLWLQLYHHQILDKEPNDELRQNFISDEMQLHTSTRPELNLIKSVIYIYTGNLFLNFITIFITIND
jgi:hypothetical protein